MSVLVVEDDRALARLLESILIRKGLGVQLAIRAEDALTALDADPDRYKAVVLDLVLPGMGGMKLLERLHKARPDLLSRVIVLTAVSTTFLETFPFAHLVWRVMRKPFDLTEFLSDLFACISCQWDPEVPRRDVLSHWFDRRSAVPGARAGVITAHSRDGLSLEAEFGFPSGMTDGLFPIPLDRNYPLTVAFRTRRPVWLASLTVAHAEYPLLLPIWTESGSQAVAAVPMTDRGRTIGVVGWSFDHPQRFDDDHRNALAKIAADSCAIVTRGDDSAARFV